MVILGGLKSGVAGKIRGKIRASSGYGTRKYGGFHYGSGADVQGIYRVLSFFGKQVQLKEKLYWPTNPRTGPQQTWRQIYADSVVAWQSLTDEQKEIYNEIAKNKPYSGYNLFQKEYLLSH